MRYFHAIWFAGVAAVFALLPLRSAPTSTQSSPPSVVTPRPTPRTPGGKPDFSGVWNGSGTFLNQGFPQELPYTPEGRAAYQYNMTGAIDPQSLCVLIGVPRADLDIEAFQVLQKPDRVAFIYERSTAWRVIPVDGRQHPEHPEPSFFGDAVGKWDGDTLVVDVLALKGEKEWGDNVGHPHSAAAHVVERWSRPDFNHLRVDLTIDDPKYYTQTLKVTRIANLQPYELVEQACDENNVDREHLGPGLGTKDGTRGFDKNLSTPPIGALITVPRGLFDANN
jgi:hypothetical protein